MKNEAASLRPIIESLELAYQRFNDGLFDGKLPPAVICIGGGNIGKSGMLVTCDEKVWGQLIGGNQDEIVEKSPRKIIPIAGERQYAEICMRGECLKSTFEIILGALLHEMVHLYNEINGVKDCSRSGTYHNTRFCKSATEHGLDVEQDGISGWSRTSLTEEAKKIVGDIKAPDIRLFRDKVPKYKANKKQTTRFRYKCPGCETVVYAQKEVQLICKKCNQEYRCLKGRR